MGIQGLLPQLRSIMQPIHVQDLRGKTVAVDTYSWLHKGAICCSIQLCKGIPTSKHIEYCMHRVKLLQHHGVKPILVFDGGLLPMKIDQETKRARKRKENLKRALEHEAAGNSGAAFDCYQKAVDISPSIAFELIQVLKQENVDYVVAPYEADAQMAFLSMYHHVDAVITEDSDLIPFGCSRIIFKMDKFGNGIEFQSSMLEQNRDLDFTAFTKQMILEMCIFSGCDYLPSLPGLGLKRAHALTRKYKTFEKVIKHLKYSGVSIPPLYEENFKKAIWTFLHQRVYDPAKEDIVHLSNISPDIGEDLNFLGPWLSVNVVKRIAKGELDPLTKMPFEVSATSTMFNDGKAFSVEKFETIGRRRSLDLPVQKNVLTNYFCLASIQAKRKFRPPKYTPKDLIESSSPSSNSSESHSPGSDEVVLSYGKSQSQDSVLKSVHSNEKCPATASLDDALFNRFNKLPESPLGKSVVNGYSGPLLEENGLDLKFTSAEIKDSVKRKVSTSPFFDNNNSLHVVVSTGGQNEFSPDGHQASFYVPNQTCFLGTLVKKRKTVHLYDKMETIQLENVKSTSTPSGQDNIPNSCKDQSSRKSFGRDISHVNDYCGIAEKSMERFVSLINTFKYTSSGSRASGLRAPLKDVRNTFPMRPNKTPVDFDEFSYKSSKKAAPMAPSP